MRTVRPRLDILEIRNVPNDVLSLLTIGPIFGSGLLLSGGFTTPGMALLRGWGGVSARQGENSSASAGASVSASLAPQINVSGVSAATWHLPSEPAANEATPAPQQFSAASALAVQPQPTSGDGLQSPLGIDWLRAVDAIMGSTASGHALDAFPNPTRNGGDGGSSMGPAFQEPEPNVPLLGGAGPAALSATNDLARLAETDASTSQNSASAILPPTPAAAQAGPSAAAGVQSGTHPGGAGITLPQAQAALSRVPLIFERNVGQTAPSVSFLSRGPGFTFFLSGASAVLALPLTGPAAANGPGEDVLRLDFVGGNPSAPAQGAGLLQSTSNYLDSNDPSASHSSIPNYSSVIVRNIYPGIDVEFYGTNSNTLEYTFIVHPGANPSVIQMRWSGVNGLSPDNKGNLDLNTAHGTILEHAPIAYQGSARAKAEAVSVARTIDGSGNVRFQVGTYDTTRDLVIDPTLGFSTYLGNGALNYAWGAAIDSSGDITVAGGTTSVMFPNNPGTIQNKFIGTEDVFVTKFNSTLSTLVYSTYLEGVASGGNGAATGVAVDSSGNAYVCGGEGAQTSTGFVDKVSSDGTTLMYHATLPLAGNNSLACIAVDQFGNAYVGGHNVVGRGNLNLSSFLLVAEVPAGTQGNNVSISNYTQFAETDGLTYPRAYLPNVQAVAVDSSGNMFIAGGAFSTFQPTPGAFQYNYPGGSLDGFVAEFSSLTEVRGTFLGGPDGGNAGYGIALDGSDNVYVTGYTTQSHFPTLNPFQPNHTGSPGALNAFVSKLNSTLTTLLYSSYLSGQSLTTTGITQANAIVVDTSGDAYITGWTSCSDFPLVNALNGQNSLRGAQNAFVTEVSPSGSSLLFSTYLGGSTNPGGQPSKDYGQAIALTATDDIVVAGYTNSIDFPTTPYAYKQAYPNLTGNNDDVFVSQINLT